MLKKGILIRWILFSACFLAALNGYFYHTVYIPAQEEALLNQLLQKVKLTHDFYAPKLLTAVQGQDDVALITTLAAIKRDPDFIYVRLLGLPVKTTDQVNVPAEEPKILAHSDIKEWGNVLTDDLSKKIVAASDPLRESISGGFDISVPLMVEGKKFCSLSSGISRQTIDKNMVFVRKKANLDAFLVFVVGFILTTLAFFLFVSVPLKKLRFAVQSVLLGRGDEKVELKRKDEVGEIGNLVNEILVRGGGGGGSGFAPDASASGAPAYFNALSETLAESHPIGVLVLDSEQHVLYGNKIVMDILKIPESGFGNNHILQFINHAGFVALLKQSCAAPGEHLQTELESLGFFVKLVSVGDASLPLAGTLIYLDRRSIG